MLVQPGADGGLSLEPTNWEECVSRHEEEFDGVERGPAARLARKGVGHSDGVASFREVVEFSLTMALSSQLVPLRDVARRRRGRRGRRGGRVRVRS